jgi:class I fructose-bisphosphate aldolase
LQPESSAVFGQSGRSLAALSERIAFIMQSAFAGRRIVVFSGGNTKGTDALLEEIRGLRDGGAHGSIVGRNAFQRPRAEALALLDAIVQIYLGKA